MNETGVIGRVVDVRSTTLRVALDVGSKGFTKAGPSGLQTVGVVNSYITVPAGAHRVVAIVTGVCISGHHKQSGQEPLLSQDDVATYELEATIVGRFEGKTFRSGLTGYPPLHAPVQAANPYEIEDIFLSKGGPSLRIGTSAVAAEQAVYLDANLLLGHHCAVVGSTGAGKSCTVTAVIDGLLDHQIPNGHIVIFDINGEYSQSFAPETSRGKKTRALVLGPKPGTDSGLFLPHWFMNSEEHLSLLRASEGVQAPILQRAIADARVAGATTNVEMIRLENVGMSLALLEGAFTDPKGGAKTTFTELSGLKRIVDDQVSTGGICAAQWEKIKSCLDYGIQQANVQDVTFSAPTPQQRDVLARMIGAVRTQLSLAFDVLGMGSSRAAPDFDAPVYYSLKELCDYFLPTRVQLEKSTDNRIGSYVATLQMRLSRLLADGRYDFMTRVEKHSDPLGSYLKAVMGVDLTGGNPHSDWPSANWYRAQASKHDSGPSVTIFDLSLIANDVLENVTALLGRILFEFAVRSQPRAEYPVLLVLEEAHRFIPSRQDPSGALSRSAAVFERIAKEGRKFGISLLLASQRPSELSETVVAQCGTVIAHRLTHEADQGLLRHATALGSRALLDQLPSLAQQHALVTGVSTGVPVVVRVRDVEDPPKSNDPDFISTWSDPDKLANLSDHIDRIAKDWQGDLP